MQTNTMPQDKVQEAIDLLNHLDTIEFSLTIIIKKGSKRIKVEGVKRSRIITVSSSGYGKPL
ncbi:hypothetical protein LCGC14_0600880 [marine sediment metagenome]|uniref:Uncharacterized protein n=1 Tax=marine sediment metagenome TaxID=412755 RepID=A0A0F9RUL4_9ZZZZ